MTLDLALLRLAVANLVGRGLADFGPLGPWTMAEEARRMDEHLDPTLRSPSTCVTVRIFVDDAVAAEVIRRAFGEGGR